VSSGSDKDNTQDVISEKPSHSDNGNSGIIVVDPHQSSEHNDAISAGSDASQVNISDDALQSSLPTMNCVHGSTSAAGLANTVDQGHLSGSHATVRPTNLMLLLLKLKHNLTKDATEDIATLINIVGNGNVHAASSVHHVCKQCSAYIGIVSDSVVCCPLAACSFVRTAQESIHDGNFFLYLSLRQQLVDLLENHEICNLLHDNHLGSNDNVNDIFDGQMYGALPLSDRFSRISLMFNCDGVPVFSSSLFSIWPILCIVNELPANVRHNHVLLAALWFGSGKPNMNVLFKPFVDECIALDRDGFDWHCCVTNANVATRVSVIVGVCDAVARPLIQNFTQFNGFYGCGYCLDEGESVEKGKGHVRVYPYNPDMSFRNKENTNALLLESVQSGSSCMGVKGPSILCLLPNFDIINGMVPDYMHCICLGVVRQMAKLWFEAKNHDCAYYIGNSISLVDKRLLSIKPPCSISRTPRSLSVMKFWKAHEWLVWLLFYSLPVLKDILHQKYYTH
jgi:hypothetical protein